MFDREGNQNPSGERTGHEDALVKYTVVAIPRQRGGRRGVPVTRAKLTEEAPSLTKVGGGVLCLMGR